MVGGNESAFVQYLMDNDPEFAAFAREVAPKGPEQAFRDKGLSYSDFANLI